MTDLDRAELHARQSIRAQEMRRLPHAERVRAAICEREPGVTPQAVRRLLREAECLTSEADALWVAAQGVAARKGVRR